MFSTKLAQAIRQEINMHAQDLGDELDGVEEVVGDNLMGDVSIEYQSLIAIHGFEKVTAEVKAKFL